MFCTKVDENHVVCKNLSLAFCSRDCRERLLFVYLFLLPTAMFVFSLEQFLTFGSVKFVLDCIMQTWGGQDMPLAFVMFLFLST